MGKIIKKLWVLLIIPILILTNCTAKNDQKRKRSVRGYETSDAEKERSERARGMTMYRFTGNGAYVMTFNECLDMARQELKKNNIFKAKDYLSTILYRDKNHYTAKDLLKECDDKISIIRKAEKEKLDKKEKMKKTKSIKKKSKNNFDTKVLKIKWVHIPKGNFLMGDNYTKTSSDSIPVHKVYLDSYYISKYEINMGIYSEYYEDTTGEKYNTDKEDKYRAITLSWENANRFCIWLSRKTGKNIRLPTEAQWEKAARGTDQRKYPWGNSKPDLKMCNSSGDRSSALPKTTKPQDVSPYGVYYMGSNVSEWCSDWYDDGYYKDSPKNNPPGLSLGIMKVYRGGSFVSTVYGMEASLRRSLYPTTEYANVIGFRIVKEE